MKTSTIVRAILLATAFSIFVVFVLASPLTRKTRVTFSQSVRVPGTVLNAGTYYFESAHPNKQTIVRISDENGKMITQVMGVADFTNKRNHDIIIFGNQDCGMNAIKAWFYPGSGTGVRFVYPEDEAATIAASCKEPVPETHEKVQNAEQANSEKIYLITPERQEQEYTPNELTKPDQADTKGFDAAAAPSSADHDSQPQ
jgi:hypothetical protein